MTLAGQTAIVTGAAAGIGRHIALRLAREGATVLVADIQDGKPTVEAIREAGGAGAYLPCDVSDEEAVVAFGEQARDWARGRVDILVNNAGINGNTQLVLDMPLASWETTLRVNLTGTMLVTREIAPIMVEGGGGRIVNVASNVARRGLPFRADYVASKWAVLGLTQTLALELVQHGIRVNAVCPGPVEGDRIEQVMQAHATAEGRTQAEVKRAWAEEAPMKRLIEPEEVAAVVRFLVSDESSAMTGQALNVTGGFIMT
jgi:NAD(P)-dependent dehydrogenase (short-subunit alcohol dehydrogenase family)